MKQPLLPLLLAASGLAFSTSSALAQTSRTLLPPGGVVPQATASFTLPTTSDPNSITFTSSGQTFITTDQGNLITGNLLFNGPNQNIGPGLDIFANIPGPSGETIPIVEVDFFTTYTGPLTLISDSQNPNFDAWFVERLSPLTGQGFRFFGTLPTQSNINATTVASDHFAFFKITPVDPNDQAFLNSTFIINGYTSVQNTPEPGTVAFLGALAVCGGAAWKRRRKQTV